MMLVLPATPVLMETALLVSGPIFGSPDRIAPFTAGRIAARAPRDELKKRSAGHKSIAVAGGAPQRLQTMRSRFA